MRKRMKLTVFRRVLSTLRTQVARRAKVILRRVLQDVVPDDKPASSMVLRAAPSQSPRALRPPPPPLPPASELTSRGPSIYRAVANDWARDRICTVLYCQLQQHWILDRPAPTDILNDVARCYWTSSVLHLSRRSSRWQGARRTRCSEDRSGVRVIVSSSSSSGCSGGMQHAAEPHLQHAVSILCRRSEVPSTHLRFFHYPILPCSFS